MCVRGAVFPAPAACVRVPKSSGTLLSGAHQSRGRRSRFRIPAQQGARRMPGRGRIPGRIHRCGGRRLYLPHNFQAKAFQLLTLRCRRFVPPCAGSEGFLQAASTGGLPPVGILCPCITGRRIKSAGTLLRLRFYHSAFLPPAFSARAIPPAGRAIGSKLCTRAFVSTPVFTQIPPWRAACPYSRTRRGSHAAPLSLIHI